MQINSLFHCFSLRKGLNLGFALVFVRAFLVSGLLCAIHGFRKFKFKQTNKKFLLVFHLRLPRNDHGLGFAAPLKFHSHIQGGAEAPEARVWLEWEMSIPCDLPSPKSQKIERKQSSGSKALQLDIFKGL